MNCKATKSPQRRSYERKPTEPIAITPIEYSGLQEAYDHFNAELFDGRLVDVFITYQRHAHSKGYFAADRFSGRQIAFAKHELALNPDAFVDRSDEQIAPTLVHEMAHCWQKQHGTPGSRGYHNREWAAKMKSLGLQPSNTGVPGGKETGQSMSHYIIPDGPFAMTFRKLERMETESAIRASAWRQKGPEQQDNIQVLLMRPKRVGETGPRNPLRAVRHQDAGGVAIVRSSGLMPRAPVK
jgi:predicted SprT family Zn-dependent metalloprotease